MDFDFFCKEILFFMDLFILKKNEKVFQIIILTLYRIIYYSNSDLLLEDKIFLNLLENFLKNIKIIMIENENVKILFEETEYLYENKIIEKYKIKNNYK